MLPPRLLQRPFPRLVPVLLGGVALVMSSPMRAAEESMRFGFSARVFDGVNANDARAAMKVWAQEVATRHGVPVSPDVISFDNETDLVAALRAGQVEAVTVVSDEFLKIRKEIKVGQIILSRPRGHAADEFLLLVKKGRNLRGFADLRGLSLTRIVSPRSCIMRQWLQLELLRDGEADYRHFWGRIEESPKLSKVVLPVFFGQADACLVTKADFEVMVELNPQLGRQLETVMTSPAVISSLFFFRGDYTSPNVDRIVDIFTHMTGDDPAGQQILTLFQQEGLYPATEADLAPTLQLLEDYERITRETHSTPILSASEGLR